MGKNRDVFVTIGRVVLINHGDDNGKLCTIIDVIDQNRALVDGPVEVTGVCRQQLNFKSLALTPLLVKIGRNPRPATLAEALEKGKILEQWKKSTWAKRLQQQKIKANMNDLDRFRSMIVHKQRQQKIQREMSRLQRLGQMPKAKPRKPPKYVPTKVKLHKIKKAIPTKTEEEKKKEAKEDAKEETKKKRKESKTISTTLPTLFLSFVTLYHYFAVLTVSTIIRVSIDNTNCEVLYL